MKHLYCIRLVNRDFSLDDVRIVFRASRFQADKVFFALALVAPCSPYERVILELCDGKVINSVKVS